MLGLGRDKRRLEMTKGEGSLKGVFKGQGCWGLPQRLLATISCSRSFKVKGYYKECTLRSSAMT